MPVKEDLLEILCCPLTKAPLRVLPAEIVEKINDRIAAGQVELAGGAVVKDPLEEALITVDNQRVYAVMESIPVMLVDESILTEQLGEEILSQLPAPSSE